MPRRSRQPPAYYIGMVLAVVAALGIYGSNRGWFDGDAGAEGECVILANGNKLCGEDAKAFCESFAADDVQSRATCDRLLERTTPPPPPSADDYETAQDCWRDLGEERCSELGFMTRDELSEDARKLAFEDRLIKALGDLSMYVDETNSYNDAGSLTLFPAHLDDDLYPRPTADQREEICKRVLALENVQRATWDLTGEGSRFEDCPG